MIKFLKESREELRKVVWPGKEEVLNSTIVVLVTVIVISLFLFTVDNAFDFLFESIIKLGAGK